MAGRFRVEHSSGAARAGILKTAHGSVETPFFMPCATKGSVKLLSNEEVEKAGTECMISNAFVLSMKPGVEVIEKFHGLHNFMGWQKPLFTDSGGFQVLSDNFRLKLSDDGVLFRNPFTGKQVLFSPEESIRIQNALGSDVAMCLDDVPKAGEKIERIKEAVERTSLWAERCAEAHSNKKQMLYGIVQGGTNKDLRKRSAEKIISLGFDGIALGGLAIGEPLKKMHETIEATIPLLPEEKPRYLMGVGSVEDMVKAIEMGVDCFDSAFPTRTARHGRAFTSRGNMNIDSAEHRFSEKPLDEKCGCFVCKDYSRALIHHLFRTKEENALKYLSFHNLYFVQHMLARIREKIFDNDFHASAFLKNLQQK
ncbi:hypothetical protein A2118_03455 [Candidatus Kaiserbacteria bacterium GWA2_50_9]|uniref:Queuine tRNA-ribosyltransferase n=1 Tax=Candidatus Kaiserbacteria bacterium GWA2_50_9 TaxID=1798474 RepID=A0A1F6BWN9_9BACT|nr:MAG: hypothetical protein A2118_03455 [Candidatus Kaiserbacteria bacterium GWA2_50_9]HZX34821.1 tRNA guanosine(34) transglycosylase Tgt [archaeon]